MAGGERGHLLFLREAADERRRLVVDLLIPQQPRPHSGLIGHGAFQRVDVRIFGDIALAVGVHFDFPRLTTAGIHRRAREIRRRPVAVCQDGAAMGNVEIAAADMAARGHAHLDALSLAVLIGRAAVEARLVVLREHHRVAHGSAGREHDVAALVLGPHAAFVHGDDAGDGAIPVLHQFHRTGAQQNTNFAGGFRLCKARLQGFEDRKSTACAAMITPRRELRVHAEQRLTLRVLHADVFEPVDRIGRVVDI